MKRADVRVGWLCVVVMASCLRPSEREAELDRRVGERSMQGTTFREADRLAAIRSLRPGEVTLWAQSPVLHVRANLDAGAPAEWRLTVRNAMPEAELVAQGPDGGALSVDAEGGELPTRRSWRVELTPGETSTLRIAPGDGAEREPYRFAVLSDIQRRLGDVGDIFVRMNEDGRIRFVVSTGDLVQHGSREELLQVKRELRTLRVPLFSTKGNHENGGAPIHWHELFGPFSPQFAFKGVFFSLIDSSAATIDPDVFGDLSSWVHAARDEVQIFVTHYPLFDADDARHGGFRSRAEAAKVANVLAEAEVDLLLFGHVHSYYAYSIADIPSYISGGGGAFPERLDGIGRHYLTVDVIPGEGVEQVGVVRVD